MKSILNLIKESLIKEAKDAKSFVKSVKSSAAEFLVYPVPASDFQKILKNKNENIC